MNVTFSAFEEHLLQADSSRNVLEQVKIYG